MDGAGALGFTPREGVALLGTLHALDTVDGIAPRLHGPESSISTIRRPPACASRTVMDPPSATASTAFFITLMSACSICAASSGISPSGGEIYMQDRTVLSTTTHQVLRTLPFSQDNEPQNEKNIQSYHYY